MPALEDMPAPMANVPSSSPMPHAPLVAPKPADLQPLTPQAPQDVQPSNDEPTIYVLQTGDNLTRLSARFGTTIPAILAANKIANPSLIFVGQSLIIPTAAPKPDVVESPAAPAPTANTAPEAVAYAPDAEVATTYTVKPGDSAITIARRLGVNVDELLTANGVVNRNRVYVGQVLTVPEGRS
jgi:LysM repeat protein